MTNILFQGKTQTDVPIIIRYPRMDDILMTHAYINTLSKEKTYVLVQGEYFSIEDECRFLQRQLEYIHDKKGILLLAISGNRLVGISSIEMKDKAAAHEGILSISVSKSFRGKGIGSLLLNQLLNEGKKLLPQLKIITLGYFSNNPIAPKLYKKFGFIEYGRLPKGLRFRNAFVDHIYMYKYV